MLGPHQGAVYMLHQYEWVPQICLFLISLFNNFFYTLGYNLILYFLLIKFQLWSLGVLPVGLCSSLNTLFIVDFVFCFEHFLTV